MLRTALPLLTVPLLCVSCSDAAMEPSQSLIDARELPSEKALSQETFYITRGFDVYGGDVLTYELRPDNSLTITHTFSDNSTRQTVKGRETLRVDPKVAAQIRQLLWRVRPAKLAGVEQDARPTGCERRGPHDFGEVTISFLNQGDKARIEDDQVGMFELPYPESCNTPAAVAARLVVRRALQLLPKSKVAARFDRST